MSKCPWINLSSPGDQEYYASQFFCFKVSNVWENATNDIRWTNCAQKRTNAANQTRILRLWTGIGIKQNNPFLEHSYPTHFKRKLKHC